MIVIHHENGHTVIVEKILVPCPGIDYKAYLANPTTVEDRDVGYGRTVEEAVASLFIFD